MAESVGVHRRRTQDRTRVKIMMKICGTPWALAPLGLALMGCSGGKPARIHVPEYDISTISQQAIELNDKDGDGVLSAEELEGAKSLRSGMSRLDADKDGKLTVDEIAQRFQRYIDYKAGLAPVDCTLIRNGRPLAGAKITYEPEPFMGDSVQSGYGETGAEGITTISVASEFLPTPRHSGVKPGFYRVRVTLADGTEVTKLDAGVECAGDFQSSHRIVVP
jgi:hypothetical protein